MNSHRPLEPPREIHQISVAAAPGDAIGNEVLQIQAALRAAGYRSEIFVELWDRRRASGIHLLAEYKEISHRDNLVLLHHSIGSLAAVLVKELPDRLVIIYHNITPASWFAPYDLGLARNCSRGRLQLRELVERCSLALGDSEYNRRELEEIGFRPTGVLPLLLDLRRLDEPPDPIVVDRFSDNRPTLLVVGRIVPNKCLEDLIRTLACYRAYIDRRARLIVVGEYSLFAAYYDALQRLVGRLGLDDVHFVGHVSQAHLNAYYQVADCFVCASEHEGFCVPVFEAIHSGVPVVAYSEAALPTRRVEVCSCCRTKILPWWPRPSPVCCRMMRCARALWPGNSELWSHSSTTKW